MTESEWLTSSDPGALLANLEGKVSERKLWLFGAACCRRVVHLASEAGSLAVIELTEQRAEGEITRHEWEDAIGRINSPLTGLSDQAGMIPQRRAAFAIANLFCVEALPAALGTAYHAWGALQLEAYPETPAWHLDGFPAYQIVYFRPMLTDPYSDPQFGERDPIRRSKCHPERAVQARILRCLAGNPFRPVTVDPAWLTSDVVELAVGIYADRAFDRLPILADALQDAGCDAEAILRHCRDESQTHVRGCWVVDLILGKS